MEIYLKEGREGGREGGMGEDLGLDDFGCVAD